MACRPLGAFLGLAFWLHPSRKDWCTLDRMSSVAANLKGTGEKTGSHKKPRLLIAILTFFVAVIVVSYSFAHPIHDFVEYWTAAHLVVAHHNPYSLGEVFKMERGIGFEQSVPIMLLSPPWTLPLIAPIGLINSYSLACLFWMIILIAAVAWSSRLLMDVYFGELRIPEISDTAFYRCLFAFTFYPVLLCLRYAQTAPLMLLGVAGFLYFDKKARPILAGAFLALTLIKPQLLYLVWLAVLLRSFQQRRWRSLASAVGFVALLSAITLLLDARSFQQYRELASTPYLQAYASGVTAGIRKLFGGVGTFWIQLVPPAFGLAWFAVYWHRRRQNWSWAKNMPMLITISVVTSAYGWLFDQTLLALPVIAIAAKRAHASGRLPVSLVFFYTALNCVLMVVMPFPTLNLLPAPICIALLLLRDTKSGAVLDSQLDYAAG